MTPTTVSIWYPNGRGSAKYDTRTEYRLTDNFIVGDVRREFFPSETEATAEQYAFGAVVLGFGRKAAQITMRVTFAEDESSARRAKLRELAGILSWCDVESKPVYLSISDDWVEVEGGEPKNTFYKAYPSGEAIDRYIDGDSFTLVFDLFDPTLWSVERSSLSISATSAGVGMPFHVDGTAQVPLELDIAYSSTGSPTIASVEVSIENDALPGGITRYRFNVPVGTSGTIYIDSYARDFAIRGNREPLPINYDWAVIDPRLPTYVIVTGYPQGETTVTARLSCRERWVV